MRRFAFIVPLLLAFAALGHRSFAGGPLQGNVPPPVTVADGGTGSTSAPTSGQILVGTSGGVYAPQTLAGDATVSSGGSLTVANSAITNAKVANGTLDLTSKVTGALPIANGGTAATSAGAALTALGAQAGPLTGDVTTSGAAATIANLAVTNAKIAAGTIDLTSKVTGVLPIANGGTAGASAAAARTALGVAASGANSDITSLTGLTGKFTQYNGISTVGLGVPIIVGVGRVAATTTAVPSSAPIATYTVGASDGSFIVSGNMLVSSDTATTIQLQVAYTDEGSSARTLVTNLTSIVGVISPNTAATGAFEGVPCHIRAKAGTTISVFTAFTINSTMTYNVEAVIQQIQ